MLIVCDLLRYLHNVPPVAQLQAYTPFLQLVHVRRGVKLNLVLN